MAEVENTESSTAMGKEEQQQYPAAYHPIPRCEIKEEPQSDEDQDEVMQHLIAYRPLPHGKIKEESEIGEGSDEFIFNGEQPMVLHGNLDQRNQEPAAQSGPSIIPSVNSPTTDTSNGTEPTRTKKRKRTMKGADDKLSKPSGLDYLEGPQSAVEIPNSSRVLRSQGRSSLLVRDGMTTRKQIMETKELKDIGPKEQQQVPKNNEEIAAGEYKSLEDDVDQSDGNSSDDDHVSDQSAAGPSNATQKTAGKLSPKVSNLNGKENPLECKNCGRCFKDAYYLKKHLVRSCHNKHQFICEECGRQFKFKYNLQRHLTSVHGVEKSQLPTLGAGPKIRPVLSFKCDKCNKTYKRKASLARHLTFECQVDLSYPCTQCNYRAALKYDLKKHLMRVHNVDRSKLSAFGAAGSRVLPGQGFKCEQCERSYKSQNRLTHHSKYECGVGRPFHCTQCDYRASREENLKRHVIKVHDVVASQSL